MERPTSPAERAARRRERFYGEERDDFMRHQKLHPKPEEPNVRVYARSILSLVETARASLSDQDFRILSRHVAEEMGLKVEG